MNKLILCLFIIFSATLFSCTREPEGIHYEQKESSPQMAAKIFGQEISTEELIDGGRLEYFQIQERDYRFKKDRLDQVVHNKILTEEAKKKNISVDELMDKHILKDPITASSGEIDKFIKEKNLDKTHVDSAARKQIESFLVVQKKEQKVKQYIAKLTAEFPVEIYFKRPTFIWPKEKMSRPTAGSPNAKVKIIEVADFQCESCKKIANKTEQIRNKYGNSVLVSYLYFPGNNRTEGRASAEAALCGFRQSANSFWKFHDLLMGLQQVPSKDSLIALGVKAGLNKTKLEDCIAKQESAIDLREHFNFANALGVRSSPIFIINGEVFNADFPIENIFAKINENLH